MRDPLVPKLILLLFFTIAAVPQIAKSEEGAADADKATVGLVIDYGDGVQKHFLQIPWRQDMNVLNVMEAAERHPRGIRFVYRGKGSTAFLTQIDDLKNQGRGHNWVFYVNKRLADRSFAAQKVGVSDTVLWKFGAYAKHSGG